jgi:hypothetical protein
MSKGFTYLVRFHVLKAASMKMTVFWDVAPCSLVEVYRRFRGVPIVIFRFTYLLNTFQKRTQLLMRYFTELLLENLSILGLISVQVFVSKTRPSS